MQWLSKDGYWRGLLISAWIFITLFFAHILLAANGYMNEFKYVAILITIHVIAIGPTIILFGQISNDAVKLSALKIGLIIAIPLNIGLGWAYAGMKVSVVIMSAFVALTIILHLLAIKRINSKTL